MRKYNVEGKTKTLFLWLIGFIGFTSSLLKVLIYISIGILLVKEMYLWIIFVIVLRLIVGALEDWILRTILLSISVELPKKNEYIIESEEEVLDLLFTTNKS